MSLLVQHQIFKQDIKKLNSFLKSKIKEKNIHKVNSIDIIDDQFEFYKSYYLGQKNTENNFIDKDLLSELISQESFYNKNIQTKMTNNFLELYLPDEDFDLNLEDNIKKEAFLYFLNNDTKILREIGTEFDFSTNDFVFNNIKEKKIKSNFEIKNMKLVESNFPENKNYLLFNDIYNIYIMNIKAIHNNLQENVSKLSTIEEIPISFLSDLYIDKLFTISSDKDFIKQDFIPENNNDINNNQQINYINNNLGSNASLHNKLSLIDFNKGQIITEYNLSSSLNNNNIYKSGFFLNNNNIVLIYSNNMLSLIDFRYKEHKSNDLLPDYNFNFNEVILLDNFQYMTLSPHKISLFDLRYPSLPKTEKVLNINYKELSVKKNKNKDFSYILFDKYKYDTTFIKLDLNPEYLKSSKIMEDFAEFHLLNNNNNSQIFIHDIVGFVHQNCEEDNEEDEYKSNNSLDIDDNENDKESKKNNINNKIFEINETYFCFILDNFNGVYMDIYDINNSNNNYFSDEENEKEENDIKNYTYFDQLFSLYKNYYKELPYVPITEENNNTSMIFNDNKNEYESSKGFGYIKINEKDKKMFEIDSKRNFFEEIVKAYENKDKNPLVNLGFLSKKTINKINDANSRKVSVNSIDSDISVNEFPGISKEDYENIKEIIDKFDIEKIILEKDKTNTDEKSS